MKNNLGISYIVPAYNEENSIANTIQRLLSVLSTLAIPYEIIVVNDGSHDKTAEVVGQLNNIRLINHPINIGYGNSLKTGIRNAQYEWIGIVDADGTYPIEDIPRLIQEMHNGFDMVIGTRENTAKIDKPVKTFFRFIFKSIIRFVATDKIEDANSGFRIFRREVAINLFPFLCGTFSFTTSLTILASGKSYFIKHLPIQYEARIGKSKVSHIRDSIRTMQYIIQGITFFNPLKFFILLAFAMILLVCIPAMVLAVFRMATLSLYYMIFGTTVTLLIALGVIGDIIRISLTKMNHNTDRKQDDI